MEVEFSRTEEDVRGFVEHLYRGQGPARRRLVTLLFVRPLESSLAVLLGTVIGATFLGGDAPLWAVLGVGLAVALIWAGVYFVIQLLSVSSWIRRDTNALLASGHNRMVLGPIRVVSDADGIRWSSSFGSSSAVWAGVERVDPGGDAVFVFLNANSALDVPRRAFPDEASFEEFFAQATEFHQTAQAEYAERMTQAGA